MIPITEPWKALRGPEKGIGKNMQSWVQDYLGIPFRQSGRDRGGLDCYGLVLDVLQSVYDSFPPDFDLGNPDPKALRSYFEQGVSHACWDYVDTPQAGDVIVLFASGHPFHCGVMVDEVTMLHTTKKGGCGIERIDGLMWKYRIMGFYRFKKSLIPDNGENHDHQAEEDALASMVKEHENE